MQTIAMFEVQQGIRCPQWGHMVTTVSFSDTEIIGDIIRLHNNGQPFDVDTCYNKGAFWRGLPCPLRKFDIAPLMPDVEMADSQDLPLGDCSVSSIMYDPPFLIRTGPRSKVKDRFADYPSLPHMFNCYHASMKEFYRVLTPTGFFAFKCQDLVSSGKQVLSHVEIINMARDLGFYCKDIFIRVNQSVMFSPNMANQQHARKTHCYHLVFTKKAKNVYQWRA